MQKESRSSYLWCLLVILLTALAYYLGTGLNGIGILVWLAPCPVLYLALRFPGKTVFFVAFSAYLLGSLNLLPYFMKLLPLPAIIIALSVPAIAFALAVLAFRYVILNGSSTLGLFIFPATWTTYEYLLSLVSPDGTALHLAYTQSEYLPVIQLASVTGIWGISFLVMLLPAGIALALPRNTGQFSLRPLMISIFMLLAVLGYGMLRLNGASDSSTVTSLVLATNDTIRHFNSTDWEKTQFVLKEYVSEIERNLSASTRVIVLPEKFVGVSVEHEGDVERILGELSLRKKVMIIAGINLIHAKHSVNRAVVLGTDGTCLLKYDKAFLVPGFEEKYEKGFEPGLFDIEKSPVGVAICKDLDFPAWLRRYSQAGVRALFVPAWDFVIDGRLHARMAVMRGVENGFSVVRSAQEGLLTISDHCGRILAEVAVPITGFGMLGSDAPLGPGYTLYSKTGDWFGIFSVILTLALLGGVIRVKNRS